MVQADENIKLYHRDIFWKNTTDKEAKELIMSDTLTFSKHFLDNIISTKLTNHKIYLDKLIHIIYKLKEYDFIKPFEAEYVNNKLNKIVVRNYYDKTHDISIVIKENGYIVTAWLNDYNDNHSTLNPKKYEIC